MRRTKKKTMEAAGAIAVGTLPASGLPQLAGSNWRQLFAQKSTSTDKLKNREVVFIFRNLATLVENGVSLPKALKTLADEQALEKHRDMLMSLRRKLEHGESFSSALGTYEATFDSVLINQIKIGEHSGRLAEALQSIAKHKEEAGHLQGEIIRKLAYPMILIGMGGAVITFLLMYVVPVFEKTYADAHVPLPFITQLLIGVGAVSKSVGMFVMGTAAIGMLVVVQCRKRNDLACRIDSALLKMPVIGNWLRDISVLQLMEVLGTLIKAGFTLVEALNESAQAINNRAVREGVKDLQSAVRRGEKFSRELERHGDLFPPIVNQLVIVGEQTGKLGRATEHIRDHLQREITRKTNIFVGTIEPVLTISLASAIAVILLAIYLPMFDMVNTVQ